MDKDEGARKVTGTSRHTFWAILSAFIIALVGSYFLIFRSNGASTGYLYYYYFDLLSSQSGVIVLAFFAGVASFFSPCAFALLPGYMSYYISLYENKVERGNNLFKPIFLGSLSGLGILMLYTISGTIVAVFGASVTPYISMMQPIVGTVIAGLGLALLTDYSFNMSFLYRFIYRTRIKRGTDENDHRGNISKKVFLYGVGYGAAAAACTAPIFISLMIYSLLYGGLSMTVTAFLTYSISMSVMMVIITMLVAMAKGRLINKMKTSTPLIKKASGFVLIIAGVYLATASFAQLF